jgi:DNA-binding transcriptional LysR family regulator
VLNLDHLRAVSKVAERGSITDAAAELRLTQSGVSRQIQKVEQELGVQLFDREHGRARLTAAGERFRIFVDDMLREYDEVLREIHNQARPQLSGSLRISASTAPGESMVGERVARFVQLHQLVSPRVLISDTAAVIEDLRERRSDVGFTGHVEGDARLHFQPIGDDEIVLAVPRDHRFADRGKIALAELAGEPFLDREAGSGTLRTVHDAVAANGLQMPSYRVVMQLGTTHAIVSAVASGTGLGWVSRQGIRGRDLSQIATVSIEDLPLNRSLYIVHDTLRTLPSVARAFIEWVNGAFEPDAESGTT